MYQKHKKNHYLPHIKQVDGLVREYSKKMHNYSC